MILPTKHIRPQNSLLWCGSLVLKKLDSPKTVNTLWNEAKKEKYLRSFQKFVLTLDFLYMSGLIEMDDNFLMKKIV